MFFVAWLCGWTVDHFPLTYLDWKLDWYSVIRSESLLSRPDTAHHLSPHQTTTDRLQIESSSQPWLRGRWFYRQDHSPWPKTPTYFLDTRLLCLVYPPVLDGCRSYKKLERPMYLILTRNAWWVDRFNHWWPNKVVVSSGSHAMCNARSVTWHRFILVNSGKLSLCGVLTFWKM